MVILLKRLLLDQQRTIRVFPKLQMDLWRRSDADVDALLHLMPASLLTSVSPELRRNVCKVRLACKNVLCDLVGPANGGVLEYCHTRPDTAAMIGSSCNWHPNAQVCLNFIAHFYARLRHLEAWL